MPTSSALVPNSPPTSLKLVPTSFALAPDSQLTVAINRGQTTTVLSEHHNKEQRKRTQRRSASMFAVFLLCVVHVVLRLYTRCQRRLKKTESNKCSAVAMWMVRHKQFVKVSVSVDVYIDVHVMCMVKKCNKCKQMQKMC